MRPTVCCVPALNRSTTRCHLKLKKAGSYTRSPRGFFHLFLFFAASTHLFPSIEGTHSHTQLYKHRAASGSAIRACARVARQQERGSKDMVLCPVFWWQRRGGLCVQRTLERFRQDHHPPVPSRRSACGETCSLRTEGRKKVRGG